MSYLQRAANLFSPRAVHFIQPYWKREQWEIALSLFDRSKYVDAPRRLEAEIARLAGSAYARSFNLGRSAIRAALESYQFPPETEVILPSFSCAGVITPVMFAGLSPVLADVDRDFNLLASSVREALSPRTRAIILPHLSGKLAHDFFEILEIARQKELKVIVDATQALGLTLEGRWIGTFGDAGAYSFNGGKLIQSSGGGVLVTNDENLRSWCQARIFPNADAAEGGQRVARYILKHGLHRLSTPFYTLGEMGAYFVRSRFFPQRARVKNHRFELEDMHVIEAGLAFSQLKYLPEIIRQRRSNAHLLLESGVLQHLGFHVPDENDNIFTKFLVSHDDSNFSYHVRKILINHGIETEDSYTPLPLKKVCPSARSAATPNTDRFWRGAFSVPINPRLNPADMQRIIHVLSTISPRASKS